MSIFLIFKILIQIAMFTFVIQGVIALSFLKNTHNFVKNRRLISDYIYDIKRKEGKIDHKYTWFISIRTSNQTIFSINPYVGLLYRPWPWGHLAQIRPPWRQPLVQEVTVVGGSWQPFIQGFPTGKVPQRDDRRAKARDKRMPHEGIIQIVT